jgi:secretion/DNA translocation related TadE-like protein
VRSRTSRRGGPDSGFATVWVVTAMALVVAAAGVAICYGLAIVQRHRAAAAADAVALAVALRSIDGPVAACSEAGALARDDGASLTGCQLQGAVSQVSVAVRLPGVLGRLGPATGLARAGPASLTQ